MQSAGFLPAALDTELPARPVRARTSRGGPQDTRATIWLQQVAL